MLTLVPLCFFFNWMLSADSMADPFNFPPGQTNQGIPMSMAEHSVDDMYEGCEQEMMEKVQSQYLDKELQDVTFKDIWLSATGCARKKPRAEDKALTQDHMRAICVYTRDDMHSGFNEAVRTQGPVYGTTFNFHSLHFLLTSAIQILNSDNSCYPTYRRTEKTFTAHVNQTVRFGIFASSSFYKDLHEFGNETCFKIKTCFGAYLRHYSAFCDEEEEVLIPPYEKFKVTKIVVGRGRYKGLKDCKAVYKLESAGIESRLNCKAVNPQANSAAPLSRFQEL